MRTPISDRFCHSGGRTQLYRVQLVKVKLPRGRARRLVQTRPNQLLIQPVWTPRGSGGQTARRARAEAPDGPQLLFPAGRGIISEVRPDWDATWINVAEVISWRTRCVGRKVGAVVVDENNRPLATGYAGPPAGMTVEEDCSTFCPRRQSEFHEANNYSDCVSIHAEVNALLWADKSSRQGGTIYITIPPCWDCAKIIANSGLAQVVCGYDSQRDDRKNPERSFEFLEQAGLDVYTIGNDEETS